ncbi:hypothetical protein D9758_015499 [Tetrapyrgos nigripes]|uniref:GOLD domain-containing protein n=1 Tax=Tetrapyrgos nigripes TaxID=182062 RepID=A0A8H5BZQ2_9AGAR|nr:hypothetical protein D9758_015499 [Tetrapyrgos nigripes]
MMYPRFFPSLFVLTASLLAPLVLWHSNNVPQFLFSRPQVSDSSTCPQLSPIFPIARHGPLDERLDVIYSSHDFIQHAFDVLGAAIRIPTESYDDLLPVGSDARWNIFNNFHKFLETTFPRVYTSLEVTKINTYGLVFHWQGSETHLKPILLASHQDVVPVDPTTLDQWTHSPYSGHYDGTWIWGRGSVDDKADLISQLLTIDSLLESGFQPRRTIVLALGFDEEAAGTEGAGKLANYLEEKYGRDSFALLIDEGEGYGENAKNATIFATPQCSTHAHSHGNALQSIGLLSLLVVALEKNPHTAGFQRNGTAFASAQCSVVHDDKGIYPPKLKHLAHQASTDDRALVKFKDSLIALNPFFDVMLRTTQAIDLVEGGVKVNALPEKASVVINHRIAEHSKEPHNLSYPSVAAEYNLALNAFGQETRVPTLSNQRQTGNQNQSQIILSEAFYSALEPSPVTPIALDGPYGVLSGSIKATLESSKRYEASRVVVAPSLALGNTDTRFYWNLTQHIFRYSHRGDRDDMFNGLHTVNEGMRLVILLAYSQLTHWFANALHFYLDANEKRCFIEELPTDTVVEGHYRALEWSEARQEYAVDDNLGIHVEVEEVYSGETVTKTKGPSEGRFTFTSHESGDHSICLSTNYTSWFSSTHIRLYLDIVVGSARVDSEHDRTHVSELSGKIRDLNQKLEDIRREQQYQREREADYRDLSEATNAKAVWYSIAQIVVLVATCMWAVEASEKLFRGQKSTIATVSPYVYQYISAD